MISSVDFWRGAFVHSPFFMTYGEIWTGCSWRDPLRRAMVFKQLRIWELATARNRRLRDFFPLWKSADFKEGLWKVNIRNSAGVFMQCHQVSGWDGSGSWTPCQMIFGGPWQGIKEKMLLIHLMMSIFRFQHNSDWALFSEQQGEGPRPKVPNKRWIVFFWPQLFQPQNTAFFHRVYMYFHHDCQIASPSEFDESWQQKGMILTKLPRES